MKKFFVLFSFFIIIALMLARLVLCQMRWTDAKAQRIFQHNNVPLRIVDTVVEGHHIHYAMTGSDSLPALVFIHGSPGGWIHYSKYMMDADLLKKYRIISVDRPGYGHSDYGQAFHLQAQTKLLLPVLQQLKGDRPMFACGHSYGGPVVAKLAADDPGLFNTIVIAAGAIDPALEKIETWRRVMEYKPLSWLLPGAFKVSNTELLNLEEDLQLLASDLDKIRAHVKFIHGDRDTWVPIENIAWGQKRMKQAASLSADTVKGARHQIPWKFRNRLKQLLLDLY